MNVRLLVRTLPAEPPLPPLVETREITWVGREVEVHHQLGSDAHTRSWVFDTADEVAEFVDEALEEWTEEGFSEGSAPGRRRDQDPRNHDVVRHVRAFPHDDAARRVLLDWLIERGEAFGAQAARWRATTDPDERRRLALGLHRSLFVGWGDAEVGVAWEAGFLTKLEVAVAAGRTDTLARKLPRVLAHPAAWLLESLVLSSRPDLTDDFEDGLRSEREELYSIVDAVIASGPHPTVRHLELLTDGDEGFDLEALGEALPGLTSLSWSGALDVLWPLPERWQLARLGVARIGGVSEVELRSGPTPHVASHRDPLTRTLTIDGESVELAWSPPRFVDRDDVWDDDELDDAPLDDDRGARLSPDEWFELDVEASGDPWGDDLPDNDPWDVGEPTHVDV